MADFYWEDYKMEKKMISIVVPVFNAEKNLEELCERIDKVFIQIGTSYQLILVDDGSKDKSWSLIEKLNLIYPQLTGIRLTKNYGQHSALLSGFTFSKGELVLTLDDDLQHPPEEIPKLLTDFEKTNADVVYGVPKDKKHSMIRNAGSRAATVTSQYGDHQGSSFRLIKKEFIQKIVANHQFNYFYLDALLSWYTPNFSAVEVEHHERKKGKSGYNMIKLLRMHFKTIMNYSTLPLRMLMYTALIVFFISVFAGIVFIYKKVMHEAPMGYTSLIVAILFSSSLIILGLGFIGLYVHKLYEFNLQKPVYFIHQVLPAKNDH
jgi:glycosyltransferase involved in cell wall biosynthesis